MGAENGFICLSILKQSLSLLKKLTLMSFFNTLKTLPHYVFLVLLLRRLVFNDSLLMYVWEVLTHDFCHFLKKILSIHCELSTCGFLLSSLAFCNLFSVEVFNCFLTLVNC